MRNMLIMRDSKGEESKITIESFTEMINDFEKLGFDFVVEGGELRFMEV